MSKNDPLVSAPASEVSTYFARGIEKTQAKRDRKSLQLAAIRSGASQPAHGMTQEEAVIMLLQDIADYDKILAGLKRENRS